MAKDTIISTHTVDGQYSVVLRQKDFDQFSVEYGAGRSYNLTYEEAAKEFGECIMHALACAGQLDTEE